MSSQGSEPNPKRRRNNAAAPLEQRQGRDTPQERRQESGSGGQQALGGAQPDGPSATPAPVQHPLAGTFAGPAGRWRQYTQREVDAYHGLLMLRYGLVVDFQRRGNPGNATNFTMSSPSHLPVAVGSGSTGENRAARSNDVGTAVNTSTSTAAATTVMGPPPLPTTILPQQGVLAKTTQTNNESQGNGKGRGKPKPPAKRYSCYHCHYTALGVVYVCRHLQNKHGVAPDRVDVARIRASEVQCLW